MSVNRRNFLKASGLSLLPAVLPAAPVLANNVNKKPIAANEPVVKLFGDGEFYDGLPYLEQLQAANSKQQIKVDRYGSGGAVEELEKKFEELKSRTVNSNGQGWRKTFGFSKNDKGFEELVSLGKEYRINLGKANGRADS